MIADLVLATSSSSVDQVRLSGPFWAEPPCLLVLTIPNSAALANRTVTTSDDLILTSSADLALLVTIPTNADLTTDVTGADMVLVGPSADL